MERGSPSCLYPPFLPSFSSFIIQVNGQVIFVVAGRLWWPLSLISKLRYHAQLPAGKRAGSQASGAGDMQMRELDQKVRVISSLWSADDELSPQSLSSGSLLFHG